MYTTVGNVVCQNLRRKQRCPCQAASHGRPDCRKSGGPPLRTSGRPQAPRMEGVSSRPRKACARPSHRSAWWARQTRKPIRRGASGARAAAKVAHIPSRAHRTTRGRAPLWGWAHHPLSHETRHVARARARAAPTTATRSRPKPGAQGRPSKRRRQPGPTAERSQARHTATGDRSPLATQGVPTRKSNTSESTSNSASARAATAARTIENVRSRPPPDAKARAQAVASGAPASRAATGGRRPCSPPRWR